MTETQHAFTAPLTLPATPRRPGTTNPRGLEGEFAEMIARMVRVPPKNFSAFVQPDDCDLQDRADTLRIHIRAFHAYVAAFMKDCADASWEVETSNLFLDGLFEDLTSDCCGCLQKAADKVKERITYRAA